MPRTTKNVRSIPPQVTPRQARRSDLLAAGPPAKRPHLGAYISTDSFVLNQQVPSPAFSKKNDNPTIIPLDLHLYDRARRPLLVIIERDQRC